MEKFKKIYGIIISIFLAVAVLLAILLVGVRAVGVTPYTVLSGSMSPTYPAGAIVYVRKVEPLDLKVRDVITYKKEDGTVVTHRIIEILEDENNPSAVRFRVQGDANNTPDGDPVDGSDVLGKVSFGIPLLGYVANFIQSPYGSVYTIAIGLGLVGLSCLPNIVEKFAQEDEEDSNA